MSLGEICKVRLGADEKSASACTALVPSQASCGTLCPPTSTSEKVRLGPVFSEFLGDTGHEKYLLVGSECLGEVGRRMCRKRKESRTPSPGKLDREEGGDGVVIIWQNGLSWVGIQLCP